MPTPFCTPSMAYNSLRRLMSRWLLLFLAFLNLSPVISITLDENASVVFMIRCKSTETIQRYKNCACLVGIDSDSDRILVRSTFIFTYHSCLKFETNKTLLHNIIRNISLNKGMYVCMCVSMHVTGMHTHSCRELSLEHGYRNKYRVICEPEIHRAKYSVCGY